MAWKWWKAMDREVWCGGDLIRIDTAVPECGRHFCDRCGDCLACFGDYCEGGCRWVDYEEEELHAHPE